MSELFVFVAVALIPLKHWVWPAHTDALSVVQMIAVIMFFITRKR